MRYAIYNVYIKAKDYTKTWPDYCIIAPDSASGFEAAFKIALGKHGVDLLRVDVDPLKISDVIIQ